MTPRELAEELGISPKTLRQWLRDNSHRFPHYRYERWVLGSKEIEAARARWGSN
jgi:predicted site-specific integrase-resolvase